ncbi:MAG: VWA domain-containing protein, partial [Chthoniobacterales bacterium]|nr:VWA domain-containing protein [Chthoniobacterales bacterium]
SINDLDTKSIPEGGTNISDAIALATRTYGKAATGNRALIIFTDGEELNGDAAAAAKTAADAGVRIFTVGVGTPGGSLIPIQGESGGTAFVKDEGGQVVKSKLNEARLREIAQATGGFYLRLENGPRTMKTLFTEGLGKMQVADINARLSRRPIERYEWPLAAAIFLFAIALLINDRKRKRGAARPGKQAALATTVAAIFTALMSTSRAASPGIELYEQQKFPEAFEHFQQTLKENPGTRQTDRIEFDSGAAAYKMKDYNKAMQSFSQALLSKNPHLEATSHYNLGNTLYERGEAEKSDEKKLTDWENALQHYTETLKAEPKSKEAKDNYDYVKKKIDDLKKKQEQTPTPTPTPSPTPSPSPQKDQNKNDKDQQKNDQQNKSQQKNDQQQQSQNSQGSGQDQKQQPKKGEPPKQSPGSTPTPTPTPTPSPSASASPSPGEESPTPTPTPGDQSGRSPSPSPGEEGTPSPTPGNEGTPTPTPGSGDQNGENGQQPSPTPADTPGKPLTGDVKGAGEDQPKEKQPAAEAEAEPEKEGEMSPKQAARLLESMKDEEQKVQLDEHKAARRVYKDW